MPNMTGRPGYRTMEMTGGSSAPYLARTPCVPLFCALFNRDGNRSAFRLPGAGGDHCHCTVELSPGHIRCRNSSIRRTQETADFRREPKISLKTAGNRRLGSVTLAPSPLGGRFDVFYFFCSGTKEREKACASEEVAVPFCFHGE